MLQPNRQSVSLSFLAHPTIIFDLGLVRVSYNYNNMLIYHFGIKSWVFHDLSTVERAHSSRNTALFGDYSTVTTRFVLCGTRSGCTCSQKELRKMRHLSNKLKSACRTCHKQHGFLCAVCHNAQGFFHLGFLLIIPLFLQWLFPSLSYRGVFEGS